MTFNVKTPTYFVLVIGVVERDNQVLSLSWKNIPQKPKNLRIAWQNVQTQKTYGMTIKTQQNKAIFTDPNPIRTHQGSYPILCFTLYVNLLA